MRLGRSFYFDSSHHLPKYKGKCEAVHGHTYRLDVVLESEIGETGMVLDFEELKEVVKENVLEELDHKELNSVLDNPTAENMAEWIWDKLEDKLPLHSIKLYEGRGKWVEKVKD
ncbi:6-carboxytetrahydropterin synthase QueD [Candidatus Altiarchaeota archaeon]